jgi:hypothetical protein
MVAIYVDGCADVGNKTGIKNMIDLSHDKTRGQNDKTKKRIFVRKLSVLK